MGTAAAHSMRVSPIFADANTATAGGRGGLKGCKMAAYA